MAQAIVSWTTLVLGVFGVLFAWCALKSRHGTIDKLSMWYLGFALPGSELSTLLATLGVVFAAAAWALDAQAGTVGQIGLVLHALAVIGLLVAIWLARGTGAVIDGALRQALGHDYLQEIAPERRALLHPRLAPLRWWTPFSYRRPEVEWIRAIPYVENAHAQQKLDLMVPRTPAAGPRPVLLNIHGGGWMIGNRGTQAMPLQMHMAANGWLVVDADYRLSPAARMPDHIVDVKRAIAWTRAHAAEHGGDPRFIAITGGSAGGHLVALAGLSANEASLQPGFEQADTSVQVVVPYYGKFDVLGEARPDPTMEEFMGRSIFPGPRAEHEALWRAMQPTTHLQRLGKDAAPPFFVLHGTNDVLIPLDEARWFAQRLRQDYAGESVYVELPHAN
ncbi:MAG TPA: alpha/beta hydrolase, partial [Rubrivivax sp.]|nr:alpha/beta hydrolase [Rubrivivax sp.]